MKVEARKSKMDVLTGDQEFARGCVLDSFVRLGIEESCKELIGDFLDHSFVGCVLDQVLQRGNAIHVIERR